MNGSGARGTDGRADRPRITAVALGSNAGDRFENLRFGVRELERRLERLRISGVYRSPPREGVRGGDFLNMCIAGLLPSTGADAALAILYELQYVEMAAGRPHRRSPGESRTLDLDLLLVADSVVETPELSLPHPRMARRDFVLSPLAEILPEWRHPELGTTVDELSERAAEPGLRRIHTVEQLR